MAKSSGLNMRLFMDGYDISGDVQAIGRLGGGPAVLDMTDITRSAFERKGGRLDGAIDMTTFFNPETADDDPGVSADRAHVALKSLPLADRIVTVAHISSGETWSTVAKQGGYDVAVAADGMITCAVNALPNGFGVEAGTLLTPTGKLTQESAGSVASVDFGVPSGDFGAQFYLQVFAFTGTSATVKIQESSDNGSGDAFADVTDGTFDEVTGRTAQRIQTERDQAVEQYLRVTTTGTFTELVFAVTATVNRTEVLL